MQLLWGVFIPSGCRAGWGASTAARGALGKAPGPKQGSPGCDVHATGGTQTTSKWQGKAASPLPCGAACKAPGWVFPHRCWKWFLPLCRLSSCLQPLTGSVEVPTRAVRSCLMRGLWEDTTLGQLSGHLFADFSIAMRRLFIFPHCFNCICFLILPWFGDNWLLQWCYSFSRERGHVVLTFGNHTGTQIFQR